MRSQVTRHALRRLLAHQGLQPSSLPLGRPVLRTQPTGYRFARNQQRRSFMGLFRKPPRTLKQLEAEPGYETLLQFRAAENDSVRPPSKIELVKAWRDFFHYKSDHGRSVNSTQVLCAQRVLLHLCKPVHTPNDELAQSAKLTIEDLRLARDCVSLAPREGHLSNLELAQELYVEIRRRILGIARSLSLDYRSLDLVRRGRSESGYPNDFARLLTALSSLGKAIEAKELLLEYYNSPAAQGHRPDMGWIPVIRGLAKEGHERDLVDTVTKASKFGLELDQDVHGILTTFYAQRDNVAQTKKWFSHEISKNLPPSRMTYYEVLQFSLRNNQKEWALQVYQDLVKRLESGQERGGKQMWDTSFQWAVMLLGKGVDHIEHMMKVGQGVAKDKPNYDADINTINRLLRVALDKNDAYLAERFVAMAEKLGLEPNTDTYLLQMEYRMVAGDLDGAFTAFQSLQTEEDLYFLPTINKFIRTMCEAVSPSYERILEATSFLEQRNATLEPETVVSICMAFLRNDEQYEVIDTLSIHTVQYSIDERRTVRKAFVDFCTDPQNSTARVWDAYALLRQFFPEVENQDRINIMNFFFERRRPDMATHVFGHMRSHNNNSHRPSVEAYTDFFLGIGRAPDLESLKMAHNMLKMDTLVQPNTKLYNSLMIAYAACDQCYLALDIWKDITSSVEGPSYESLEIAFRTYEVTPDGDEPARELWEKIQKLEIDVSTHVYSAYVTALAAHGHVDQVKSLLSEMENVTGERPNLPTIAIVYNALQSPEQKDILGEFAQEHYAPVWKSLNKKYKLREVEGTKQFKYPRRWKA